MLYKLANRLRPLNIEYEIIHSSNLSKSFHFENNSLKTISTNETSGIGLRIIKEGKIGFAATTNLKNIDRLINQAIVSAKFGKKAYIQFPDSCKPTKTLIFDDNINKLTDEILLKNCQIIIENLKQLDSSLKINTQTSSGIAHTQILNSSGLYLKSLDSGFSLFADILKVDNNGMLMLSSGVSSASYQNDTQKIIDKISNLYRLSQINITAKTEKLPVIFTPRAVRMLMRMIIQGINGKTVQKGISPLGNKLEKQIISPMINLIDDPSIDFAYGSCQFDMEGTEVFKKYLVKNGILKTHLYDLQTANQCQTTATGNATRSFSSQPNIDISNLVLEPGDMSLQEIYTQFPKAIIVENILGEGQGNSLAGEFSVNISLGFIVENGQIIGRVKDAMLAGNIYEFGNQIVGLSTEQELNGSSLLPYMLVDNLSISGKAK